MGIYTESILNKDQNNKLQVKMAEGLLLSQGHTNNKEKSLLDQTQFIAHYVLKKFGYKNIDWVDGTKSIDDLLDCIFEPAGIMYNKQKITKEFLKNRSEYIIAFTENNQAVILIPSITGYRIKDISTNKTLSLSKVKLKPDAYIVFRPLIRTKKRSAHIIKIILSMFSIKDLIPLIACTALVTLFSMLLISINKYVLSDIVIIPEKSMALLPLLLVALFYIGVGLVKVVTQIVKYYLLKNTVNRIVFQVQSAIMMKLLLQKSSFFKDKSSGKTSLIIKNTRTVSYTLLNQFFDTGIASIFSICYITQMFFLAPNLILPSIIMVLVQICVSIVCALKSYNNNVKLLEAQTENNNFTFQTMKGIQKIKTIGAEDRFFYKWAKQFSKIINHSLNTPKLVMLSDQITQFLSNITSIVIIMFAILYYVPYANYNSYVIAFGTASGIIFSLVDAFSAFLKIKPNIIQLKNVMDKFENDKKNQKFIHELTGSIQAKNVSFKYEKSNNICLDKINFTINPGEKIAFVGKSGSGKSTIMKLLLGLEIPNNGIISYDNIPLLNINLRSLRKRIGSVFQFSQVIPGTLRENILFSSNSNTTDKEIWWALKAVAIDEDVKKLPLQLDTEITDSNNGGFSGGQKQRLLIARAIVNKPSVIILDEATSALDNVTQNHVLNSIYDLNSTVIMVAHRISTIKRCDKIYVIHEGKIIESGKYDDLIKNNGFFTKLVKDQVSK